MTFLTGNQFVHCPLASDSELKNANKNNNNPSTIGLSQGREFTQSQKSSLRLNFKELISTSSDSNSSEEESLELKSNLFGDNNSLSLSDEESPQSSVECLVRSDEEFPVSPTENLARKSFFDSNKNNSFNESPVSRLEASVRKSLFSDKTDFSSQSSFLTPILFGEGNSMPSKRTLDKHDPEFQDFVSHPLKKATKTSTLCPETPYKQSQQKPRFAKEIVNRFVEKVKYTLNNPSNLTIGQRSFALGTCVGNGQHSNVYEVVADAPLFEGYENDQLLVKCYKEDLINKSSLKEVESFADCSLRQYHQLLTLQFPIAKILNAATVKEDGFFIVEKIPREFVIENNLDLEVLNDNHPLRQVKWMMQEAFTKDIFLDLSKSNVRLDKNGQVILIDFMEHEEDGDMMEGKKVFGLIMPQHLETFAKDSTGKINEKIWNFLMPEEAKSSGIEVPAEFFFSNSHYIKK